MIVRTHLELLEDQLAGMRAWNQELRQRLDEGVPVVATRQARVDARHRLEALERTQQALLARADDVVRASEELLRSPRSSALVVHRNAWLRQKVSLGLADQGLSVLDGCEDGAEGLGTAIAEQPDLLLVEDRLPSLPGLDLVRQARRFLPRTVVAAHVEDERGVAAMIEAGASAVFTRRVPPATLVEQLVDHLQQRPEAPLLVV